MRHMCPTKIIGHRFVITTLARIHYFYVSTFFYIAIRMKFNDPSDKKVMTPLEHFRMHDLNIEVTYRSIRWDVYNDVSDDFDVSTKFQWSLEELFTMCFTFCILIFEQNASSRFRAKFLA